LLTLALVYWHLVYSQKAKHDQIWHSSTVVTYYCCDIFALQAENTYLLTLDGDIDFKAESVTLLVDRMKKNKKVGAACGRIHPIGTGILTPIALLYSDSPVLCTLFILL